MAETPNRLVSPWIFRVAVLLPVLAIASGIYWSITGIGTPFFLVLLIEAGILTALRGPVDEVLKGKRDSIRRS